MKKSITLVLMGIDCLTSCNPKTSGETIVMDRVNTDSLVSLWNTA